jgi:pyruvate kinase
MPNPNSALAEIKDLLSQVRQLRDSVIKTQQTLLAEWEDFLHHKKFRASAANLSAYIGLRRHDLRELQMRLARIGLSSRGRSEAQAWASRNPR